MQQTAYAAFWSAVTAIRRVPRDSASLVSPYWLDDNPDQSEARMSGVKRRIFPGSVRAVVTVPNAEANASEPAMRVLLR